MIENEYEGAKNGTNLFTTLFNVVQLEVGTTGQTEFQ